MKINFKNNKSAFSIVEIMAVIFIIAMGMVGMMNLIGQSIRVQRLNEHTLIAYQLAQEGIELVRVIRDDSWLDIEEDLFLDILEPGSYCLDFTDIFLNTSDNPCRLYLNANNFYVHSSVAGAETPYSRLITITEYTGESEPGVAVNVTVKITWEDVGGTLEYEAETRLYNWF